MSKALRISLVCLGLVAMTLSMSQIAAAQLIIIMEEAAQLTLDARMLGGEKKLPADALERERRHMQQFGSTQ